MDSTTYRCQFSIIGKKASIIGYMKKTKDFPALFNNLIDPPFIFVDSCEFPHMLLSLN